MYGIGIALQDLKIVGLVLCRRAFHLSGKLVPYILIIVLIKLIYVIVVIQCPFLSRLACCKLNLADKHGITLIPTYIHIHLSVEANYLSWGRLVLEWYLLPNIAHVAFQLCSQPEMCLLATSCTKQCQYYYTLKNNCSGCLGFEWIQSSLEIPVELFISVSCISSPSCVQVSDRASLASHCSQHLGRHSSLVSHDKRYLLECFGNLGAIASAITAFNPLAAQGCVL